MARFTALFFALATVTGQVAAQTTNAKDNFSLFAYGKGIGGLPVFYKDGKRLNSPW